MPGVVERFIKYIQIDTESAHDAGKVPSTEKQFNLARLLAQELTELGLQDVSVDEHAYVMATLPANIEQPAPVLGLIAHMDTSPDMSGADVKPQFVENYDGGEIVLNAEHGIVLSPRTFPELLNYTGQTLITTDGSTLLGADDKAGIAEILAAVETLVHNPQIPHGTLKIGFTPDEEVGAGVDFFDVQKFGADVAYTIDGGEAGEINYETFNAAGARVSVQGSSVHPGTAKNKMINALRIVMELDALLPPAERPEHTEGYEGFFHLVSISGGVEEAHNGYIIRDHNRERFEARKATLQAAVDELNRKYGPGTLTLDMHDQYYNLDEVIRKVFYMVDIASAAVEAAGLKPIIKPVRGGTDGSRLSFMGLPTPNIFTGGHNAHGKFEYVPVQSMQKAVEVILNIVQAYAKRAG